MARNDYGLPRLMVENADLNHQCSIGHVSLQLRQSERTESVSDANTSHK